uniref:Receptor ligand binding region domain-containing protein n=1 Tax=Plectus sambesii TaxID=2011161 RepID=A0A914WXV1_9BILA
MAYRDLKEQGIIPPAYDFILHSRPGCALYVANLSLLHGVEEAIDLYFNENVDVFFGSPCSEETVVIGQMAAAANWNLPVLGYLSSDDSLSDKNVYNTLARTTVISATFFAQAVKMVVAQNGWKKVAYVGSNTLFTNLNRQAVVSALAPSGVDIFHMSTEANPTWQSIASNKAMTDLKANARVVLVMFGSEMNTSVPFMAAAHSLGYTTDPDFVFIIFSLANNYQSRPWDADYNGMSYPYLRAAYEGAYIIRIAGLDFASVNTFRQKLFAAENYTNPVGNDASIMPMYDAVFLYGMALNKSLADTGNKSVFTNGARLFQYMKNIEFTGVTSQVLINNDGERIPSYLFSRLPKNVSRIYTNLMLIEANRDDHCEPAIQGNLCYPYNITLTPDYLSITWPPDIPKCGYRYEKCDNTLFFTLGGVILASVIAIILVYYIMKKRRESLLYLMPWRVSMESVKLLSSGTVVSSMISMTSLRDSSTSVNSKNVTTSLQQALVGNTRASVRRYKQLKRISFSRRDLNCLYY